MRGQREGDGRGLVTPAHNASLRLSPPFTVSGGGNGPAAVIGPPPLRCVLPRPLPLLPISPAVPHPIARPRPHSSQRISDVLGLAKLKILSPPPPPLPRMPPPLLPSHTPNLPSISAHLRCPRSGQAQDPRRHPAEGPWCFFQGTQAGSRTQSYAAVEAGVCGGGG